MRVAKRNVVRDINIFQDLEDLKAFNENFEENMRRNASHSNNGLTWQVVLWICLYCIVFTIICSYSYYHQCSYDDGFKYCDSSRPGY